MENDKDIYDRFGVELDFFFGYSGQRFLMHMHEMLQNEGVELYTMPTIQRRILGILTELVQDSMISIKDLAAFSRTNKSDVSRAVQALEEKGYVRVKTYLVDRRIKLVQITPEGRQAHNESDRKAIQIAREYFRIFHTDEQMEEIVTCLRKLNDFWCSLEPERYFPEEQVSRQMAGGSAAPLLITNSFSAALRH